MEDSKPYGVTRQFPAIDTAEVSGDLVLYDEAVIGSIDCITNGPRNTTWAIELAAAFGDHEEVLFYKKDAVRQLVRVYRQAVAHLPKAAAQQEATTTEDTPEYSVVLLAAPPTLSYEDFCQQAQAKAQALSPQYVASCQVAHTPAHHQEPARTVYKAQVWDTNPDAITPLGFCRDIAYGNSPEQCLADLKCVLRRLEQADYEASACYGHDAAVEAFQAQEAYA